MDKEKDSRKLLHKALKESKAKGKLHIAQALVDALEEEHAIDSIKRAA